MMQRRSPPKHRHDGTSPLPLGMDWSPAPRKWNGRDTVWPHDPRTGWSYCVSIPSWVVRPRSRDSDPVVFYRVQVGIQSTEGITTTRVILRRFNDFLKLFASVKKEFPKKTIPPTPPKGFLRMKTRALLEERKNSLEDWMTKLLSDIDISRSVAVASFLELEAAARSSFQDENQHTSGANSASNGVMTSLQSPLHSSLSVTAGSSSVASEYGSDTAYETSELGTPSLGRDDHFDIHVDDLALDEDLASPMEKLVKYGMSNIDEGLFMGETILEHLEGLPRHKVHDAYINNILKEACNRNTSKAPFLANNGSKLFSEIEHGTVGHNRKLSNESVDSETSSLRGSEKSDSWVPNSHGDGSFDLPRSSEVSNANDVLGNSKLQFSGYTQLVLPFDQRPKMKRVLLTMQQRLVTVKTDMEDLISRLNQEVAVKDYLAMKVKDLEVELESTKQKSKENIQQAILVERERLTQMQWDMEELRRRSLEMELKLKPEEGENSRKETTLHEKDALQQELDTTKGQLENLMKRYEDLEAKSKADIKVLVKEVKSLRSSRAELKRELSQSLKEKFEAENWLHHEKEMRQHADDARKSLLQKCRALHSQLQECKINFPSEDDNNFILDSHSLGEAVDMLTKINDRISLLLSEAQHLSEDDQTASHNDKEVHISNNDARRIDAELRKMVAEIFIDSVRLTKQVHSVIRLANKMDIMSRKVDEETPFKRDK